MCLRKVIGPRHPHKSDTICVKTLQQARTLSRVIDGQGSLAGLVMR